MKLKVNPDVAILSKAMSNGFPSSAIIGKKSVMDQAQNTFVSSCMWTERIGFVAALATMKKMKKKNVVKDLISHGKIIKRGWLKASKLAKLDIKVAGIDPIPQFSFNYNNNDEIATYFIQEMKNSGFLANTRLGTTYAYNKKIISQYLESCEEIFEKISRLIKSEKSLPLKGPVRHNTFKRLI